MTRARCHCHTYVVVVNVYTLIQTGLSIQKYDKAKESLQSSLELAKILSEGQPDNYGLAVSIAWAHYNHISVICVD